MSESGFNDITYLLKEHQKMIFVLQEQSRTQQKQINRLEDQVYRLAKALQKHGIVEPL